MRENKSLKLSLLVLLIAVLCISVGYAAYSTVLNISGIANINRSAFSIHYDENSINVLTGSDNGYALISPSDISFSNEKKNLSFETTLNLNEETRFTINVVNDGTIKARINSINLKVSSKRSNEANFTELANISNNRWSNEYLDFYVVWTDGEENILDTLDLDAGSSKNMTLVIRYKQPNNYMDLPNEDVTFKFEMNTTYSQSNYTLQNESIKPKVSSEVGTMTEFLNILENNEDKDLIINLTDDIDLTSISDIQINNDTIIELNGKTLEVAPNSIGIYDGATVIVEDNTENGLITGDRGLFNVYDGGKLVINGGNYVTTNNTRGSGIYLDDGSTLEINGGNFKTAYYVIGSEGVVDITLNAGVLESTSTSKSGSWAYAVKVTEGLFTMNGGTIKGIHGALALDGDAEAIINGGEINVNESYEGANDAYYCMYVTETSSLNVYDGLFQNNGQRSLIYTTSSNYINLNNGTFIAKGTTLFTGSNINVTGGKYSHDVTNYAIGYNIDYIDNYYQIS